MFVLCCVRPIDYPLIPCSAIWPLPGFSCCISSGALAEKISPRASTSISFTGPPSFSSTISARMSCCHACSIRFLSSILRSDTLATRQSVRAADSVHPRTQPVPQLPQRQRNRTSYQRRLLRFVGLDQIGAEYDQHLLIFVLCLNVDFSCLRVLCQERAT